MSPATAQQESFRVMARAYVTLNGYQVRVVRERAIGINKAKGFPDAPVTWLPRAVCTDGDQLDVGDEDIVCWESMAEEKELDFK